MIKITSADKALGDAIKAAVDYRCQRCGRQYPGPHQGLHASHYISRGNWSTRFHPDNVFAHCYGCHQYLGSRPPEFTAWVRETIGEIRLDWLERQKQDTSIGRLARKSVKDIAKHYRGQLLAIKGRREKGEMGDFNVVGWH